MKKKILSIFLILVLTILPIFVYAEEIKEDDSNFLTNENIVVEQELAGSLFTAGLNVKVKEKVDGAIFAAGNVVAISDDSDYIFAAGQNIQIDEATTKDAFVAGQNISINESSIRDLFVAGQIVTLNKVYVRNARLAGEKIVVKGKITGDLNVAGDKVTIDDDAVITGKLIINEDAKLEISEKAKVGGIEKYESKDVDIKINPLKVILALLIKNIISYLSILAVACIMIALFKKFFANIKKMQSDSNSALKSIGIGLLTLCTVPVIAILLLVTIIGIPLGVILILLYVLGIYISAILSNYYVGSILFKDKIKNEYLMIALTLLIYYLIKWIPIAGGLLELASLLLGLGIFVYQTKTILKK